MAIAGHWQLRGIPDFQGDGMVVVIDANWQIHRGLVFGANGDRADARDPDGLVFSYEPREGGGTLLQADEADVTGGVGLEGHHLM